MNKISNLPNPNGKPRFPLRGNSTTHLIPDMQNPSQDLRAGDRLHLVNERTGEALDSWVYDGRVHPEDKNWIRLYQRIAWELANEPKLTLSGMRVWLAILAKTSFGNAVEIQVTAFAKHFGFSRRTVSTALKTLVDLGVIERIAGRRGSYRLNPNYGWKGSGASRHHQLSRWAAKEVKHAEHHIDTTAAGDSST